MSVEGAARRRRKPRFWRHSPRDAPLAIMTLAQPILLFSLAATWSDLAPATAAALGSGLALVMTYDIIIVGHLFTHARWFRAPLLNEVASAIASFNLGQSAEGYRSHHVFNHHRYSNDRADAAGETRDESSTFRGGVGGEHVGIARYAFGGAVGTLLRSIAAAFALHRGWRVGRREHLLRAVTDDEGLRRIRRDRIAHGVGLVALGLVSWPFLLACYLPAWYAGLVLVNVQNYYEHFGARPGDRRANSVSHYGRLYNALTFNDGFHQEHHLRPGVHWRKLPSVRAELGDVERVLSPVPAVLGFLDRRRVRLDRAAPRA